VLFFVSLACADDPEVHYQAGNRHLLEDDYQKAIQEYEAALAGGTGSPEIYNNLGLAYSHSGLSYTKAVENFKKAIELEPDYPDAYADLGLAYIGAGEYEKAIKSFQQLLEIDPGHARGYFGLGWAYLMGKIDSAKAIQAFEKAIQLDPGQAEAYLGLGLAFVARGQKQLALEPITVLRKMNRDDLAGTVENAIKVGDAYQESLQGSPSKGNLLPSGKKK
jgi:tetratricopeptide (TPR) repeat protein